MSQGSTTSSAADRRASVRYPCSEENFSADNSCRPITSSKKEAWPATVRNLSTGGLGIIANRRFEPGTLLVVDVQDADQTINRTFLVRVVHLSQESKTSWLLGCAFPLKMSESDLLSLM
jgi:hypothetical protein